MVQRNVPLVQQLILKLLEQIDTGMIVRSDGFLPSEVELVQRFGVSRATIRDALSKLETAGIIVRRQGIGTYLSKLHHLHPASLRCMFDQPQSFMDLVRATCGDAQLIVLDGSVRPAEVYAGPLGIPTKNSILVIEKLFLTAGVPLIHSLNIIPLQLVRPERREAIQNDYSFEESTYEFLEKQCNTTVHHQQSEVQAIPADERLSQLLRCAVGDPLLWVGETGYTADLTPAFHAVNHFRGNSVSLLLERRANVNIARSKRD